MVRASSHCLRISLAHVLPFPGLPVELRSSAVIHLGRGVYPDHSRTTAGYRIRCCRLLSWRRSGLSRYRSSRRSRSRHGSRIRLRSRRSRHRRRLGGGRRRSGQRSRRGTGCRSRSIPILHALVPAACPLLYSRRGVRPILALPGRASRSASRSLPDRKSVTTRSCQRSSSEHQPNRLLHPISRIYCEWPGSLLPNHPSYTEPENVSSVQHTAPTPR